jgi:hypothetical protein
MPTLLDQFLTHTSASTSLPYAQIVSPPNIKQGQLEKGGFEIGIFLKAEQAELAGFFADDTWTPTEVEFSDGVEPGFICQSPKFVVIHKSALEVQFRPTENDRFTFVGLGWENGQETELHKKAKADTKLYKRVSRHLLLFLSADDSPLHSTPIACTLKGGFGGSLYAETTALYAQLSKVFFANARSQGKQVSGGSLSPFALAFAKVDIAVTWCKTKADQSPFCVPASIKMPTIDNVGKDLEVQRQDRKIIYKGVSFDDAMVDMTSEAGKLITQWFTEYKDFSKPRRELPKYEGRATTFSDIMYQDNGDIVARIPDGKKCRIPADLAHIVMGGEYEISGVIDGSTIVVKSAKPFDDGCSPMNGIADPKMGCGSDDDDFGYPPY